MPLSTSSRLSSSRHTVNGEEQPGGLVIVRAPAPSNRSLHIEPVPSETRAPSRPPSVQPQSQPSKPPAKKLRTDSSSRSVTKAKDRDLYTAAARAEPEVDEDMRQMQSEVDTLKRRSLAAEQAAGSSGVQMPPRTPNATTRRNIDMDTTEPIASAETPQIEKNKMMRGETGHRRRSSVGRGKRISSSYEATGVICKWQTVFLCSHFHMHANVRTLQHTHTRPCRCRVSSSI